VALPWAPVRYWFFGWCVLSILRMVVRCCSCGVCIVPELQRNISTMEELDYYLCHGNIDFVSSRMPTTGIILVKESETYSDMLASSYEIKSLEEAVWTHHLRDLSLPWFAPSDAWFSYAISVPLGEFARSSQNCEDVVPEDNQFVASVKEEFSVDSWDCGGISDFCSTYNGSTIRILCPVTCGCAHPQSPLFLNGASSGCPLHCRAHEQYHPNWTDFVRSMAVYYQESGAETEHLKKSLLTYGCEAVQSSRAELCVETAITSAFALWCPVECGCRVPNGYYDTTCPPSCEQWRSEYEASLADLPCEDASAPDFISGPSKSFLDLHIATFQHAFGIDDMDAVRWQLVTYGCGGLHLQWCSVAKNLRAVCPVICGCLENFQPGCRPSCFSGARSTNASFTSDGLNSDA